MLFDIISAVVFYSIVGILIYKFRKKMTIESKIMFLFKGKTGLNFMKKIGNLSPSFWKIVSTVSLVVTIYFMFATVGLWVDNALKMLAEPSAASPAYILIPGIPTGPVFLPFWYGIICIFLIALIHEVGHGIVACAEKIKLNSSGFGFLAFILVFFVEQSEKSFKKASRIDRMRMSSMGPAANIFASFVIAILLTNILDPAFANMVNFTGVNITSVVEGKPAYLAGVTPGVQIYGINNITINRSKVFANELLNIGPNKTIKLITNNGTFFVNTTEHPANSSLAYIGIYSTQGWKYKEEFLQYKIPISVFEWFLGLLGWLFIFNFWVGIMNCLPIVFADGGHMLYDVLGLFIKKEKIKQKILVLTTSFVVGILLFNILGSYII